MAHEMDPHPAHPALPAPNHGKLARTPAVPSAAQPPALSSTPDALSLLKALRRRWLLAGALGMTLAAVAFTAAWLLMPPRYFAFAQIQVSSKHQEGFLRSESRNEHTTVMKTTVGRLKGRDVLMRTLSQDGVRNLATVRRHPDTLATLAWLDESLKVDFRDGSELVDISLSGEEPADLVVVVNALIKSYLHINSTGEAALRKERLKRYQELHEIAKEKLAEKVAAKEALLRGQGAKDTLSLVQKQLNAQQRLQRAQDNMTNHQFDLDKKNARMAVLMAMKKNVEALPAPEIPVKDIYELDPALKQDVAFAAKLEDAVRRYTKSGARADDSGFVGFQRELAELRKKIDDRVQAIRAELVDRVRKKQETDIDVAVTELKTEIVPLESHIGKYQEQIDVLSKEAQEINLWTAKQNLLESEIQQQEKAVAQLFDAVERAKVEADAEARVTQIGDADWQVRDSKKRIIMLGLAPLAAFLSVLLAVSWWEFAARRIHGPEEVVNGLAMRVVGAVPELPDRRRAATAEADELYRHNLVESVDAIRTMLLRNASAEDMRTIMVTSAVGGEGKTTLASNLAMSLARAGRRTLLIDCDLRRPAAHQLFEQTLQPGFSEVVLHEVELPDAVRPTTTDPNLYLLPAGQWDREVIQELAKTGITSIFEKLRDEFDFIIVDSHPVLPATDSLLIGQHVDAVIVSLMQDVSQVHHVHAACQQLATLGIRVFGAVVNGVPVKAYGKGYQYTTAQPVAA